MAAQPVWRFRGYLPHCDRRGALQSITFRLADSLPHEALDRLEWALRIVPPRQQEIERRRRLEQWLDAGTGCCALRHPEVASVVKESLLRFHGDRYALHTWCLMPNHVHVLIEAWASLETIVRSWKSYTGRWALAQNVRLGLGIPGKVFWMRDYWDRFIRDRYHLEKTLAYIHENPVKAGLCSRAEEWPWSSCSRLGPPGTSPAPSIAFKPNDPPSQE